MTSKTGEPLKILPLNVFHETNQEEIDCPLRNALQVTVRTGSGCRLAPVMAMDGFGEQKLMFFHPK
jgi:hypothetical protein